MLAFHTQQGRQGQQLSSLAQLLENSSARKGRQMTLSSDATTRHG
jgi:hypothetical protein